MLETLQDSLVLLSRFPLPTIVVLGAVILLPFLFSGSRETVLALSNRHGHRIARLAAVATLGAFLFFGAWYCLQAGFACEVEPMVASVSWHVQDGGHLYHAQDASTRYSVLYGPSVYLVTGFILKIFGPSISAAKFGALLALSLSLLLLFISMRRYLRETTALLITAMAALVIWMSGTSAFVVRPDPFLILGVSFGLFCAQARDRRLAALGVALAFGFTVNLKIHAGLYFLPIAALLDLRHGWRTTLTAVALGHAVMLAPFALHPGISPNLYLSWVLLSLHHGLEAEALPVLLSRGMFMSLPVLILLAAGARFPDGSRLERQLGLAWIVGNIAVLVLALKPGAGLVHMLPLVPINAVFTALLWANLKSQRSPLETTPVQLRRAALTAFMLTALISGSVTGYRSGKLTQVLLAEDRALARDVQEILSRHHDQTIAMGYGGEGPYFHRTYMRPLLTFADQPLLLDAISQMDAQRASLDMSDAALAVLDSGDIDMWLIPRDQRPFIKQNWYAPHEQIFPREYIERFHANYELKERSRYFDLWQWSGPKHTALAGGTEVDAASAH